MKLIKGVVGFVVVLLVVVLVALWLLPPRIIHWAIEDYGSQAVGAKVDVGSVEFSWLASQLQIHDLAVTNASQPMTNAVQFDRIATQFDLMRLFDSKVYLDLVLVEGIALDGARETSGALPGVTPTEQEESGFALPDLGLPDPSQLIEKEKAIYLAKVEEFNDQLNQREQRWQAAIDGLPDETNLDAYEKQWKQAKSGNFLEKLEKADGIRKKVKKDIDQIKSVQSKLDREYEQLQTDYRNLKGLSNQSMAQIIDELGLSESVVANIGNRIASGQAKQWLQTGYSYYNLLLGGEAGPASEEEAAVSEPKTSPDFLIRLLRLTGPFQQGGRTGTVEGEVTNISDAPSLHPEAIKVDINALGEALGAISLVGMLDHTQADQVKDQLTLKVKDSALSNFSLADSDSLSLALEKATLNLDAQARVGSNQNLDFDLKGLFSDLAVQMAGQQSEEAWAGSLLKSLQNMDRVSLNAKASGKVSDPTLTVSTNLNNLFKSAFSGVVKQQSAALEKQVKGELDAALSEQIAPLESKLGAMASYSEQADGRLDEFKSLLKSIK